jgi:hypothetical protein
MWTFLITTVLPLHWVTEAPVSSKPNGASDKYSFYCLLSLDKCRTGSLVSFFVLTSVQNRLTELSLNFIQEIPLYKM